MLTAAMCRAEGIPSRTAVGLIYADVAQGPVFAFHMWTEIWINGRWLPIDATRATGYVGATHLKITDHSWHDTRTLTPLFPWCASWGASTSRCCGQSDSQVFRTTQISIRPRSRCTIASQTGGLRPPLAEGLSLQPAFPE